MLPVLALWSLLSGPVAAAPPVAPEPAVFTPDLHLTGINGDPLPPELLRDKVLLIVNVASFCGYTAQYAALQSLNLELRKDGLLVVGVPCNQFGGQEPGTPTEIRHFCTVNFGVTFPLLMKQEVNGPGRSPLYAFLVNSEAGGGQDIQWNFEKFLVGRDGQVLGRYGSGVAPDSPQLRADIAAALAK